MYNYQSPAHWPFFPYLLMTVLAISIRRWKQLTLFCEASDSVVHAGDMKQAMSPYDVITKMKTGVMCDSSTCLSQSPIK